MVLRKLTFLQKKQPSIDNVTLDQLKDGEIPKHIALIMDGNGRWAKKRSLPRVAGHHEGMKTVRDICRVASQLGVGYITLYAFSTENWKRPKKEVDYLMKLPEEFLRSVLPEIMEGNIRVMMMGQEEDLPEHTLKPIYEAVEATKNNTGLVLNFALNYGSRLEITAAVQQLAADVKNGLLNEEDITEDKIQRYLYTNDMPDPDLLIRTSGELRISNFMLWQIAYSEFYFTDVLWPDFDEHEFCKAIATYQTRNRRYGGILK